MKITGGRDHIKFDLENGYVMKARGELLVDRKFVVYKDTMQSWEAPHEEEKVLDEQIEDIIRKTKDSMTKNTVQILFE